MPQANLYAAQVIDLTGDEEEQAPPRAARRTSVKVVRPKARGRGVDIQELNSHHQLGWWKTTYFKQYKVETELQLVKRFPLDSAIIRTIVPNRYLRAAGAKPLPAAAQRAKRHVQTSDSGFPGKIKVLNGVKAIEMAYQEHSLQHCKDVRRLALFTDGSSSSRGRSGSAVVYRKPEPGFVGWFPWQAFGFKAIGQKVGSSETECLAIIKAMDIARDLAQDNPGWLNTVYIYTDAKGVLDKLIATQGQGNGARRAMSDPLMQFMVKKGKAICTLVQDVTLVWCPGHSNVPGNELADRVAALAAKHTYNNEDEYIDLSDDDEDEGEGEGEGMKAHGDQAVGERANAARKSKRRNLDSPDDSCAPRLSYGNTPSSPSPAGARATGRGLLGMDRVQKSYEDLENDGGNEVMGMGIFGGHNPLRGEQLAAAKDEEASGISGNKPPQIQFGLNQLLAPNPLGQTGKSSFMEAMGQNWTLTLNDGQIELGK